MNLIQKKIAQLIVQGIKNGEFMYGLREVSKITDLVSSELSISDPIIREEDAEVYLRTCILRTHEIIRNKPVAEWSKYRWIWYLRRFPDEVLEGSIDTTGPYEKTLMESLADYIAIDRKPSSSKKGMFPITPEVGNRLARFTGIIKGLSQLHVLYRICGKGAPLVFNSTLPYLEIEFPDTNSRKELTDAIRIYDERVAEGNFSGRMGAPILIISDSEPKRPLLFTVGHIADGPKLLPFPFPHPRGKIWAKYRPSTINVEKLSLLLGDPLLDDPKLWDKDLPVLLAISLFGVFIFGKLDEKDQANVFQSGYLIYDKNSYLYMWERSRAGIVEKLAEIVSPRLAEEVSKIDDIVDTLSEVGGSLWPPRSGSLSFPATSDQFVIDLYGATINLGSKLQYPKADGKVANIRAEWFEKLTQDSINETDWKPCQKYLNYINKNLSKHGEENPFGEIDSLAVKDDIGIFVSCKSSLYDDRYDRGEYSAVRNVRTNIEEAISDWRKFLNSIRANPEGNNYEFNDLNIIVGIVISPHPIFLDISFVNSRVLSGLREYSTYEEFRRWLSDN